MMNYLSTASKEQLQKDWEEFKDYNNYGPLIDGMLEEAISRIQITPILPRKINVSHKNTYYDIEMTNSMAA